MLLLEGLLQASKSVELLAHIPDGEIQRGAQEPLFWD
jgi:hypothetical protein